MHILSIAWEEGVPTCFFVLWAEFFDELFKSLPWPLKLSWWRKSRLFFWWQDVHSWKSKHSTDGLLTWGPSMLMIRIWDFSGKSYEGDNDGRGLIWSHNHRVTHIKVGFAMLLSTNPLDNPLCSTFLLNIGSSQMHFEIPMLWNLVFADCTKCTQFFADCSTIVFFIE